MSNISIKEKILEYLKEFFKKEMIKRVFGRAIGGVKLFLAVTALNYLWKKLIGPGLRFVFRKIEIAIKRVKYQKKAKKLEGSKNENDFNSSVDDLP